MATASHCIYTLWAINTAIKLISLSWLSSNCILLVIYVFRFSLYCTLDIKVGSRWTRINLCIEEDAGLQTVCRASLLHFSLWCMGTKRKIPPAENTVSFLVFLTVNRAPRMSLYLFLFLSQNLNQQLCDKWDAREKCAVAGRLIFRQMLELLLTMSLSHMFGVLRYL